MSICQFCGNENPENATFCGGCGAKFTQQETPEVQQNNQPYAQPPVQQNDQPQVQPPYGQPYQQQPPVQPPYQQPYVQPQYAQPYFNQPYGQTANTTGQFVWSILNLIFCCLILGIISLVTVNGAKSAMTKEEFDSKMKTAKTLNLIATIVGAVVYTLYILLVIIGIGSSSYYY